MALGRLEALITATDTDFNAKMKRADLTAKRTAGGIKNTFSNLKLSIPSISGGLTAANVAGGNILTGVLSKLTTVLTGGVTVGIEYNKMLQTSAVAFETLGMSAADTQKHLKELEALGLRTPFEFKDLIRASLTMNAFGFSTESRIEDLRKLSDAAAIAAAGTGDFTEALNGVIFALGQMRAKGKVSAEEMNQLAERGIPAWDILAKKVGKTKEELVKLSEQGKLKGDVAAGLLTEGLGEFARGAGDRLSETVLGKESNFKDKAAKRAGEDSKALFEAYGRSLETGAAEFDQKTGQGVTKKIGDSLAGSLDFISDAVAGKISSAEFLEALKKSGVDMWSAVQSGFVGAISSTGAAATDAVKGWASSIIDSAKKTLGIQSPSTVFAQIGDDAIAGFNQGIERNIDRTSEGFRKFAKAIEKAGGDEFIKAVEAMGARLKIDPNKIMNVMAFETGGTFSPGAKNPKSSATGLIQFMADTAEDLGTTVAKLKAMSAVEQLKYVEAYWMQFKKLADTQESVYTSVLAGRAVKDPSQVLFAKGGLTNKEYVANQGLDADKSGRITAAEATARVLEQGFLNPTKQVVQSFDAAVKDFSKTVLQVGNLGTVGVTRGQTIQGGGAAVDVRATFDPEPLAELPDSLKKISNETTLAKRALDPLPLPLKQIAQDAPQAASGMNAVSQASKDQIKALFGGQNRLKELQQGIGQSFDGLIAELKTGQEKATDTLKNFARQFSLDILNSIQENLLMKMTGKASIGAIIGDVVGSFLGGLFGFGGKKAAGGPVKGGTPYLVGEEGPELYVPNRNGTIIPAGQTRQMMGGANTTNVINITIPVTSPNGQVSQQTRSQIATVAAQQLQFALGRNG